MSVNSDNQLKFDEGKTTEPLTITRAGEEEMPFGNTFVVHIKPTIEGYDHFLPSDGLIDKLKKENVDVDDKITIEKVAPSDKYKYGYFSVKVVEKNAQGNKEVMDQHATGETKAVQPIHKSDAKFEEQFKEKNISIDTHELNIRVAELERCVAKLNKEIALLLGDAGHKPGDEEIPF